MKGVEKNLIEKVKDAIMHIICDYELSNGTDVDNEKLELTIKRDNYITPCTIIFGDTVQEEQLY